jgi:hypothetical protein
VFVDELEQLSVRVSDLRAVDDLGPLEFGEGRIDGVVDREVGISLLLRIPSVSTSCCFCWPTRSPINHTSCCCHEEKARTLMIGYLQFC